MRQLSDKSSVVNSFYFALVSFETFVFEGRGVCVSVEVFQSNGTTSQGIPILWIPVATGLHARFVKLGDKLALFEEDDCLISSQDKNC